MQKILIINLRRLGDVYSTAHLINSLSSDTNNQISLLTYKESSKAVENLKNISTSYELDRKEVITLKANKLFSDGFALEHLFNQMSEIKSQKWDHVINFSNDKVGTYLTSYLKDSCEKITGVHFSSQKNVISQNDWEILFNDILPVVKFSPIHFIDCFHKMSGTALVKEGLKLQTSSEYNELAMTNINAVKKAHGSGEVNTKIIGIQLKTADPKKDIPEAIIHDLIHLIRAQKDMIPFLLIAPTEGERRFAEDFNRIHNDELIIVEADLQAVTSVLLNIDLLVTPDTAIKHIADLANTPVLEISLGHAPFLKQGSYSNNSLVLTDNLSSRVFLRKTVNPISAITANDILASILFSLSSTKKIKPRLSEGVTLYQAFFDQLGISYVPVAGTISPEIELHRTMTRQLINSIFKVSEDSLPYTEITNIDSKIASSWANTEKLIVSGVLKDILGTLRSLMQATENRNSSREFVNNLGKLISHVENEAIVQIPVLIFKCKIEAISVGTFEENAKEVEMLLFELKDDMQKILTCLENLDKQINIKKIESLISKNHESIMTKNANQE
jgi:ADP-heptose:LPS heptosyltransferase